MGVDLLDRYIVRSGTTDVLRIIKTTEERERRDYLTVPPSKTSIDRMEEAMTRWRTGLYWSG